MSHTASQRGIPATVWCNRIFTVIARIVQLSTRKPPFR